MDVKLSGKPRLLVTTGFDDLVNGLRRYSLWGRMGLMDVKRRYRRTMIGPFWNAISLGVLIAVMGSVGIGLWKQDPADYIPFLASGMMVWLMVSTMILESCSLFINSQHLFGRMRLDYSIFAYALAWRNLVAFSHNLVVYLAVAIVFAPKLITFSIVLIVPGLFLVSLNAVWVALLLGMVCVRFRDVQQLVSTVLQISLFVTPILWSPELLSGKTRLVFVDCNPLYAFIDIVREPLLGKIPIVSSYSLALVLTLCGWAITLALFSRFRRRIAFWV
jgi:ABC-type polysaccharide/polyol phosphate export permease